jgi:hypothetical protein
MRTTQKAKGRAGSHTFVQFPHRLLTHWRFHALSSKALKALMFLACQYRGHNNGDLTIAWKVAKASGLTSNSTLRAGTFECIEAGFALQSRQGGRNRCSLYALTWFPIDECGGKLDIASTRVAPINWTELDRGNLSELNTVQCALNTVQSSPFSIAENVH